MSTPKFDFSKLLDNVKETFKKNKEFDVNKKIGLGSNLKVFTDDDFIKLGEWWTVPTGVR